MRFCSNSNAINFRNLEKLVDALVSDENIC
jgi:hypothetical protein